MCIIKGMPPESRSNSMTLRLTDEEVYFREKLAELNGIDGSGVMRMGLRKLAKQEGIPPYEQPALQGPTQMKKTGRRSKG